MSDVQAPVAITTISAERVPIDVVNEKLLPTRRIDSTDTPLEITMSFAAANATSASINRRLLTCPLSGKNKPHTAESLTSGSSDLRDRRSSLSTLRPASACHRYKLSN